MNIHRSGTFVVPFNRTAEKANSCRVYGLDRYLAHTFLHAIGDPPLRLILWDGKKYQKQQLHLP